MAIWGAIALCWVAPQSQAQFNFPVQPVGRITCTYSAVPNQVRSENLAARLGEARLDCTNNGVYNPAIGPANNMAKYVLANITVSLNTAVTTNLGVGGDGGNVTSSVLIINDNDSSFAVADSDFPSPDTCGIEGSPPFSLPDPRYPCPQKGQLAGPNAVSWNVQLPIPGAPNDLDTLPTDTDGDGVPDCVDIFNQTSTDSCFNTVTTVRITNLFGNAAAVGAGGSIFANLSLFSFAGISVTPSNQQTVANVFQGLNTEVDTVGEFQCVEGIRNLNATFEEGFANAFKVLGEPTVTQGDFRTESGYPLLEMSEGNPPQVPGAAGGATQATRFMIQLTDVPDGVVPSFPNTVDEDATGMEGCPTDTGSPDFGDLCVQRVEGADEDGAGGAADDGSGDYDVPLVNGDGRIIYEVRNADPSRLQEIVVPATFTCMAGSPTTNLAVATTFAPLSDEGEAGNFPIPRFVERGDPHQTAPVDLRLVKEVDKFYVFPGVDQVVYTLSITNHGNSEATGVELVDTLEQGLTYVSDDSGCGVADNVITCPIGTLGAGATVDVLVTASVDGDADGGLINNAAVSSDTPEPVPDPNPNMDFVWVVVPPDLTITSLTAPTVGELGGTINVSVDVANLGSFGAGPFQVGFYFSTDSVIETSDPAAALTCVFLTMFNTTRNCTGPIDVPIGLPPATYHFGAIADIAGVVTELSETNNTRVSDNGPILIPDSACPVDVTVSDQTLNGIRIIGATNSVVLGANLVVDGESISVDAPNVSILSGTSISGAFSIGNNASCL